MKKVNNYFLTHSFCLFTEHQQSNSPLSTQSDCVIVCNGPSGPPDRRTKVGGCIFSSTRGWEIFLLRAIIELNCVDVYNSPFSLIVLMCLIGFLNLGPKSHWV